MGLGRSFLDPETVALENDSDAIDENILLEVKGATRCVKESEGFLLAVGEAHVGIPSLLRLLEERQLKLKRLTTRHVNLEDIFVSLTGRHLRDV